jgi:hypothetical protein
MATLKDPSFTLDLHTEWCNSGLDRQDRREAAADDRQPRRADGGAGRRTHCP